LVVEPVRFAATYDACVRVLAAASLASSPSVNDDTLTINITIAGGKTTPSGQKINLRVGQKVILNVTSDGDDEIRAHIGGPGYALPVQAENQPRDPSPPTVPAASRWSLTILGRSS